MIVALLGSTPSGLREVYRWKPILPFGVPHSATGLHLQWLFHSERCYHHNTFHKSSGTQFKEVLTFWIREGVCFRPLVYLLSSASQHFPWATHGQLNGNSFRIPPVFSSLTSVITLVFDCHCCSHVRHSKGERFKWGRNPGCRRVHQRTNLRSY